MTAREQRERAKLERLIERYHGNLSEISRALTRRLRSRGESITRQGVSFQLEQAPGGSLLPLAAAARAEHGVFGRRKIEPEAIAAQREKLINAAAKASSYRAAAAELGMSERQLYRKLKTLEISARAILTRRRQLKKLPAEIATAV